MDWLGSLPAYLAANDATWAHRYLSLPGLWRAAPLALGAVACAWAARSQRLEQAVFIAIAAALLGSMHALDYDAAILAPFAVAAGLNAGWRGAPFLIMAGLPASPFSVLALGVLASTSNFSLLAATRATDQGLAGPR